MIETTRDRLATVAKRIKTLEAEANKKFQDAGTLHSLHTKLCVEILAEEKLLAGKWVYVSNERVVRLEAAAELDGFPKVEELLSPRFNHEDYHLCQNTILRFDDGIVLLLLPHETATQFIKDHGITVDWSSLTKGRDKLASQLKSTDTLIKELVND